MNKYLLYFVLLIFIGCQSSNNSRKISFLNESKFKYHNVKQISFPNDTNEYVSMDSIQKNILFKPYLENDLKSISFGFDAYFIARQEKIYSFTPIIVEISGTDYSSQWLMLLDSNFVTRSKIELGHEESGPRFANDSTNTFWPETINYFSHDSIKTISIIKTERNQGPSNLIVDSIICVRKILSNGEIITVKSDSLRFIKK